MIIYLPPLTKASRPRRMLDWPPTEPGLLAATALHQGV
jgi:hypothetical protein